LKKIVATTKSVYENEVYDSAGMERTFAEDLEQNEAVERRTPSDLAEFKVPTPLATYNPDWPVLIKAGGVERLDFDVEKRARLFDGDLRDKEAPKIECGKAHFTALATGGNRAEFL
jgi:type III restriction enzyme